MREARIGTTKEEKPKMETAKRLRDLLVAEWLDGRRSLDDLQLSRWIPGPDWVIGWGCRSLDAAGRGRLRCATLIKEVSPAVFLGTRSDVTDGQ
jgi:hypothetical protein